MLERPGSEETATRVMAKYIPCPFCGERLEAYELNPGDWIGSHPRNECLLSGYKLLGIFKERVLAQWNRRS